MRKTKVPDREQEQIAFRNPVKAAGFAQVYHMATLDPRISDGAYRLFCLYLMYAQQKDLCWPGRATIADMLDTSEPTISRRNTELENAGYVQRKRRQGSSSITYIEDIEHIPFLQARASEFLSARIKNDTYAEPHISETIQPSYQICNVEEEQDQEEQVKSTAVADSPKTENPAQAHIERMRAKLGDDPFTVAANCQKAQESEGTWTVPEDTGGDGTFDAGPLQAFCDLAGMSSDELPDKQRKRITRGLRTIGDEWNASPALVRAAIEAIPRSEDYGWLRPTSPYSDSFKDVVGIMITRQRNGGKNGGAGVNVSTPQEPPTIILPAFLEGAPCKAA